MKPLMLQISFTSFTGSTCLKENQLLIGIWELLGNHSVNATCPRSTGGLLRPGIAADGSGRPSSADLNGGGGGGGFLSDVNILDLGLDVYAYVTPFVIVSGIVGNFVSLTVFLSIRMRKVSASLYLACLAVSDSCVLLTYALFEWLQRGLPRWPGGASYNLIAVPGVCQGYLFASYAFRFMSAWFIVAFTVERFVGILMPIRRRVLLSKRTFARRSLGAVALAAVVVSVYKPILATVTVTANGTRLCSWRPDFRLETFVLDSLYGSAITVIPFVIMLSLNVIICRKLRHARRRHLRYGVVTRESSIKLEFTAILLVVSTAFVALNVPYFVTWCFQFASDFRQMDVSSSYYDDETRADTTDAARGWKCIAKTIFYGNYCVNFFVYSLSGAYFRFQLRRQVPSCIGGGGRSRDPSGERCRRGGVPRPTSHGSTSRSKLTAALMTNRRRTTTELPMTQRTILNNNGLFIINKI